MGFSESCNGRKRPYHEDIHETDDGCKKICKPEYNKEEEDVSIQYVVENDDVFVYSGAGSTSCLSNSEKLMVNGDLGSPQSGSPVIDYTLDCGHLYGTTLVHKESDEVGKSDVGLSCYEEENPLEGLDLFFDDVALDFGVHEDDTGCTSEFFDAVQDKDDVLQGFGEEQVCEDVGVAVINGGNTEQAFIGENEVHDWLFSSEQTDPSSANSMGYCSGDVLEPSLAHLLEGMAGT